MSYPQFSLIVSSIAKKISWDLKLAILPGCPEAGKDFNTKDMPLCDTTIQEDRVMKMEDAMAIVNLSNK